MPRNISAASLAKLATPLGTEPIVILEIEWVDGSRTAYADRDIPNYAQKAIQEITGLQDVVEISLGQQSQQVSVVLSDTDGAIKGIMDTVDVHNRPCWIYQYFGGLSLSDKFLVFHGVLNSPLEWDEGARTFRFEVISKIEDVEVGFSIEEGSFTNPPDHLIGQAWPLCFGTVINVPALRTNSVRQGELADGTGIKDFTLERRLRLAEQLVCPLNFIGFSFSPLNNAFQSIRIDPNYETDPDCLKSKCETIENLELQLAEQSDHEISPVRIFGGDRFPQDKHITLDINGGKFKGRFNGEMFTITGRKHPDNDGKGNVVPDEQTNTVQSTCGTVPPLAGSFQDMEDLSDGIVGQTPTLMAKKSKESWDKLNAVPGATFFWADPGSVVTFSGDDRAVYIVNLLPSTILRVAAFRTINGIRRLVTVPEEYYTVRQVDYTGYTGVMEIVFPKALSNRDTKSGSGWDDDIYVTMTSTVGPNTVDILRWFIETYTDYSIDSTSFDAVETLIDNYPMHFPVPGRKNLITVLQEIAYQARCAIWLKDGTFYIKYLPLEPPADDTITEDDVLPNTLKISHTSTEDVVTKSVVEWRKDYAVDDLNKVIFRHNVLKYGTRERIDNFYCFNILELVRKAATFWLIRKANTWRRLTFQTPLSKLKLETFDTVALTLPDVAPGTIKGVVEKATFNSDNNTVDYEIWTPCKAGTMVPYDFAWPADVSEQLLFPTIDEENRGFAGSGREPNFSVIAPNNHELANNHGQFSPGFKLDTGDGSRKDHGQKKPSDRGDTKPTPKASADKKGKPHSGKSPRTGNPGQLIVNPYEAAAKKADRAFQEAQQARMEASQARDAAGGNEPKEDSLDNAKDKLPDEVGGNCTCVVTIHFIIPTLVATSPDSPVFPGNLPGAVGGLAVGDLSKIERYTFNSKIAAEAFGIPILNEINARSAAPGFWVVGKEDTWLIASCVDLGIDEDPDSETFGQPCVELGAEEHALVGFNNEPA